MFEKDDAAATTPRGCGRGDELVAYLYGEATREEAALFGRHLDACAVCREELASLGGVREAVGLWRAEALGTVPSLNIEETFSPAAAPRSAEAQRRSARAALREFFSLSPLWLRAGALAATLAVCALFALTLARAEVSWGSDGLAFRAGVTERVLTERVQVPTQVGYTEEQVNAIVAQRVAEAKAQSAAGNEGRLRQQTPEQVISVADKDSRRPASPPAQRRKRPTRTDAPRDETLLAEDDLPRLSDLLRGSY